MRRWQHGWLISTLPFPTQQWELDDNVMADYGARLCPRAIGYSAGLIDYFFRGRMTGNYNFVTQIPFEQRPNSIGVSDLTISDTTGSEQAGSGAMRLVLIKYSVFTSGANVPPVIETFPDILVSNEVPINSTLSFPFSSLPFPAAADLSGCFCYQSTDYVALLVFRGTLENEV